MSLDGHLDGQVWTDIFESLDGQIWGFGGVGSEGGKCPFFLD